MDNPLWEKILVDWVNCLKLSKPIQKLDDLRDGLFFSNLQKVLKKSSEVDPDVLSCIFGILNEHYSQFVIPNNLSIHLNDLPLTDLAAITSILMHYTCIHDRRDVLTSPLCYNLQEFTQIKIRNFLERVQECTNISYKELATVIENCTGEQSQIQNWLSSNNFNNSRSPLQDVLKTPVLKSTRMIERDKEIAKLKSNLELVQEEKETLEEELKNQITKNKKLEKQLNQKTVEISNLRSEVLELESRTPPHYRDRDFRDMQKLLRTQVESLEQILEQCEKENEQLQEERDKEKVQVRQLESQCKTWLEKFIDTEKCLQSITENYKEQLTKNENLQSHCIELEALLEELRPKSKNESYIDESFHSTTRWSRSLEEQPGEDLAHSVVDIQLKELQKENEKLKTNLDEINVAVKGLKKEINILTIEKEILIEEKHQLESEHQASNEKIEEFNLINKDISASLAAITKENENMTESMNYAQDQIDKLITNEKYVTAKLTKAFKELDTVREEKEKLSFKLDEYQLENAINLNAITDLKSINETIIAEKETLFNTLQNVRKEKEICNSEKANIKNLLDSANNLSKDLKEQIIKLTFDLESNCSKNNELCEKINTMENAFKYIETDLQNCTVEKANVADKYELCLKNLDESNLKIKKISAENKHLALTIKDATEQFERFKTNEEELSAQLTEMSIKLESGTNDKEKIAGELNECHLENERNLKAITDLKSINETLIADKDTLFKKLQNVMEEKEICNSEKENLKNLLDNADDLSKDLKEQINKLTFDLESNCSKNNELCEKIITMECDFKNISIKMSLLETDLQNCTVEKSNISEQYEICSRNLDESNLKIEQISAENEHLTLTIKDAKDQLEAFKIIEKELSAQLTEMSIKLEYVTNDKEKIACELTECQLENETNLRAITDLKLNNETLIVEKDTMFKNLQKVTEEKEIFKSEKGNLKNLLDSADDLSKDLKEQINKLTFDLESNCSKNNELCEKINTMENAFKNIETDLQNCTVEKANISEQYEICLKNLDKSNLKIGQISAENEHLTLTIKDAKDQLETFKTIKKELSAQLTEMSIKLESITNDKQKIAGVLTECQLENEINLKSITDLKSINETLIAEKDTLFKNLQNVTEENEIFKSEIGNLKNLLDNADDLSKNLKEQINKLTFDLESNCSKNNELSEKINTMENAFNNIKTDLQKCTVEKANISDQYELCLKNLDESNLKIEKMSTDNEHLTLTIKDAKDQLETFKTIEKELSAQLTEISIKLESVTNDKQKITGELTGCQLENEINLKSITYLKSINETLFAEKDTLFKNLQNVTEENEIFKSEIGNLKNLLDNSDDLSKDLKEQINKLKFDQESNCSKNNELCEKINTMENAFKNIETDLQKCTVEKANISEQYELCSRSLVESNLKIEKISTENEHQSLTIKDAKDQLEIFKTNEKELTSQLIQMSNKLKFVSNDKEKLAGEFSECQFENERLLAEIVQMQLRIENLISEKEYLSKHLQEINLRLSDCQLENEKYLMVNEDLKSKYETLVIEKECLSDTVQKIAEEKTLLSNTLDLNNNELEKVMQQKIEILGALALSNKDIDKIMNEKECILEENNHLVKANIDLTQYLNTLKHDYEKLSTEKNLATESCDNLSKKLEVCHQEVNKLLDEKKNLLEQLSQVKAKFSETEVEINNLGLEKSSILEEKTQLEKNLKELNKRLEEFEFNYETLTKKNEHLSLTIKDAQDQLETFKMNKKELSSQLIEMCNKLESVTNNKAQIAGELNECQLENGRYLADILQIKSSTEQLISEKEHLSKSLQETVLKLSESQLENEKCLKENKDLKSKYEALVTEKDCLSDNIQKISEEKTVLSNFLDLNNNELQKVMQQKDEILDALALSNKDIEKILNEKECILEENDSLAKTNIDLTQYLDTLKQDYKKVSSEKNLATERFESISKKLEDCYQEVNKLLEEKNNLLEQLYQFKTKLSEKEIEINKKSSLIEEKNQLKKMLQESNKKLEEISSNYQSKVKEMADIEEELKYFKTNLENSTSDLKSKLLENEKLATSLEDINNIIKQIILQINSFTMVEKNEVTSSEDTMATGGRNLEIILKELRNNLSHLDSEFKHVYTEKENLEHLLDITTDLSKDLKEEINKLAFKLESNQSRNKDKVNKFKDDFKRICLKNLKDSNFKNEETSAYLESLTAEKDNLSCIIKKAQDQLETASFNNKELSAKLTEISNTLEIISNEKENVLTELSECELKNEKYVKEIAESLLTLNTYKENNEKLSAEKNDILERFEKVNKELDNYSQKMDNLSKERNNLLEQVEKLSQVKAKFSEQLDQVSQENADLSDKIQNMMKKNYENSEYIKDLLQKVEHLTSENTELLVKITTVSNDLEEKSKNVLLLEATSKELKKQLDEKSAVLDKLSEENRDIFDIVDRLSQEKTEMMHTIDSISEEKMQLLKALEDLSNEIEELSQEKAKLKECLDLSEKELQKVKKDRNEILEDQTKIMKETESNLLLARQSAVDVKNDLLKRIEIAEEENEILRKQLEQDSKKIQESYLSVVTSNSKLELETHNLRKKIDDKNRQLNDLSQIKEAYEKLVEENNSLLTEIDTIKFKRSRDREEFVTLLKKEREEADFRESKRVKEVRNEYEAKLEKMKDKMLKLYREEVNKEMLKVKAEQSETMCYLKTIEDLRNDLSETERKAHLLETKLEMQKINEAKSQTSLKHSKQSLTSIRSRHEQSTSVRGSLTSLRSFGIDSDMSTRKESMQLIKKGKSVSTLPSHTYRENIVNGRDRRLATLPRANMTEIQETITISRRTSLNNVPNLEMEDEDDDFNNKYLADLKAGKCVVGNNGKESTRFSELAWRNSMVPPHLKSSYPAETQFVSPSRFKEDDLKVGNIDLDDSLCKLLPGEKPRQKKDFGTTSYKKPGPPTPSKNGGRASLQSNEIQPLREQNERSPKKMTPSRIKSLFMGKTSIRENSENQSITPRTLRKLSIFRKQK